jgi:hypothetical protein
VEVTCGIASPPVSDLVRLRNSVVVNSKVSHSNISIGSCTVNRTGKNTRGS